MLKKDRFKKLFLLIFIVIVTAINFCRIEIVQAYYQKNVSTNVDFTTSSYSNLTFSLDKSIYASCNGSSTILFTVNNPNNYNVTYSLAFSNSNLTYTIDGAAGTTYTVNANTNKTHTIVISGTIGVSLTISVNTSLPFTTTHTQTVSFDNVCPTISFSPNLSNTYIKTANVTVTVTDNESLVKAGQTIKYRWQMGTTCSSNESDYTSTATLSNSVLATNSATASIVQGGLTGTYYLCVYSNVQDVAGNHAVITRSGGFLFDNSGVSISFNPDSSDTYVKNTNVTVIVTDNESLVKPNQSIKYRWQTETTCSTNVNDYTSSAPLSNATDAVLSATATASASGLTGTYYLCVYSDIQDVVGNNTVIARSGSFLFDSIPPTITLPSTTPVYLYKYDTTAFTALGSATDTGGSSLASFSGMIDGEPDLTNVSLGAHSIGYVAVDKAGNVSTATLPVIVYAKINCALSGMVEDPTDSTRCIFRGSDPNNWIRFNATYTSADDLNPTGGYLYRIIGNEIVYSSTSETTYAGKIVHATDLGSSRAFNGAVTNRSYYTNSTLRSYLVGTSSSQYAYNFQTSQNPYTLNHIQPAIFYDGTVSTTNTVTISSTVTTERNKTGTITSTVGLPNVYDYLLASTNCNGSTTWETIKAKTCDSNNWMVYTTESRYTWFVSHTSATNVTEWLSPGYSTYASNGPIYGTGATNSAQVRPVIYLKNSVIIIGGSGTELDPYLLAATKMISGSAATCEITTTPSCSPSKTLTVNINTNGVTMDANPISWTSSTSGFGTSNTQTINSAGTYRAYIKDSTGEISSCAITLTDQTEYRQAPCNDDPFSYTPWAQLSTGHTANCQANTLELWKKECMSTYTQVYSCQGSSGTTTFSGYSDNRQYCQASCSTRASACGNSNFSCSCNQDYIISTRSCGTCSSQGAWSNWQTTPIEQTSCSSVVESRATICGEPETVIGLSVILDAEGGTIGSSSSWEGSGSVVSKQSYYGEPYGTLPTPVRSGYAFLGWTKGTNSRLPSEYQEVKYLESTGTQYINTGYYANKNTGIIVDFAYDDMYNQQRLFGGTNGDGVDLSFGFYINSLANWAYAFNNGTGNWVNTGVRADTNRHTLQFNMGGRVILDNTAYDQGIQGTVSVTSAYPMYIMAENRLGNVILNASAKIYSFKIYDNTTLVRNFVPCYRISDGVAGMYDLVNGVFYTNAGTGSFVVGGLADEIVSTSIIQEVESHTLHARWIPGIAVTLVANGGSIPASSSWDGSGSTATKSVMYNLQYGNLPIPTRSGYTFVGWSYYQDYQKLEYIESTGTQYINTGFTPNQNTSTDIKYKHNGGSSFIYGARQSANNRAFNYIQQSDGTIIFDFYTGRASYTGFSDGEIHIARQDKNENYLDYVRKGALTSSSFTSPGSMYLFTVNQNGTAVSISSSTVYYFKIWNNGTLTRDFVPVQRMSDGAIGMYDEVNGVFYENAGSGEFVKGNDLAITPSTNVEKNENHTLYALWKKDLTVTFNPAGGSVDTVNSTVLFGEPYGDLPIPTRDGYNFMGWSPYNGYQEVGYIESTGTQYINTELKGSLDFDIDFQTKSSSDENGNAYYFGQRENSGTIRFALMKYNDQFHLMTGSNGMWNISYNTNRHIIRFTSTAARIDGVDYTVNWGTGSAGTTYDFLLFAANYNGTIKYNGGMRIYSAKFTQNSSLVRDFVPVYRMSDGVIGLYDKVNNVFYTRGGSGTFNKGNNVVITESTKVKINDNHTLYALWEEIDTTPTCTVTTTSGYDTTKTLTINVTLNGTQLASEPYSWDNSTWSSTNTRDISAATTYTAYVKDEEGKIGNCSLKIKSRKEWQKRTCNANSLSYSTWSLSGSSYLTSGNCQEWTYELSKRECPNTYTGVGVCNGTSGTTGSSFPLSTCQSSCTALLGGNNLCTSCNCYPEYKNYTRTCSCSSWGSWSDWLTTEPSTSCSVQKSNPRTTYGT